MYISMTTYNRYEYLWTSLESLLKSEFPPNSTLFISDDHSTDRNVIDLLKSIEGRTIDGLNIEVLYRQMNVGVGINATEAARQCFASSKDDYIILTNSDAIYNPRWILELMKARENLIYSGVNNIGAITAFNMEYKDKDPYGHQVTGTTPSGVRVKKSCGGLGVMINRVPFFNTFITRNGWDCRFVDTCYLMNYGIYCTDKSYVQHIGVKGLHSRGNKIIDVAKDFVDI